MSSDLQWQKATAPLKALGQNLMEFSLVIGLVTVVSVGTLASLSGNVSQVLSNTLSGNTSTPALTATPNLTALAPPTTPTTGGLGQLDPSISPTETPPIIVDPISNGGLGATSPIETPVGGGEAGNVVNNGGSASGQPSQPQIPPENTPSSNNFSPEYQQLLTDNPNIAQMINSMSPQGQEVANDVYEKVALGHLPYDALINIFREAKIPESDKKIYQDFINATHASVKAE